MNIFLLSPSVPATVRMLCDRHVVKMCLETAQILSSALHLQVPSCSAPYTSPYRPTHLAHPCVEWAARSPENFLWTVRMGYALCGEYSFRFSRVHSSLDAIREAHAVYCAREFGSTPCFALREPLGHALALGDMLSRREKAKYSAVYPALKEAVALYRRYYRRKMREWRGRISVKWTSRPVPAFLRGICPASCSVPPFVDASLGERSARKTHSPVRK